MNIRQKNLTRILSKKYLENDEITFIDSKDLKGTQFSKDYINCYQQLGGIKDWPQIRVKGYLFENRKFAVVLDDQLHFNKYRLMTLRSLAYEDFKAFKLDRYRILCKKFANECLKSGSAANWTDPTSENLFGASQSSGDLGLKGSSGWKYRAFCDFTEDVYSLHAKVKLLRVSIYDEILINHKLIKIGDILVNPKKEQEEFLLKYLDRRILNLYA